MKARLLHNIFWKVLSLLIALVLWFIVVREPELVTSHAAPIFLKNLPGDLEIGSDLPDRVYVEIRGPSGKLTPASLAETAVVLDLAAVHEPGERTFNVSYSSLNLPRGVAFLRAVPSQLRLRFNRTASKMVPVQIQIAHAQPAGYRILAEEAEPVKLKITGPEDRVGRIEAAQTDGIDLSAVVSRAEFRVHAFVSDPRVRFDGPSVITVRVTVEKIDR